MRTQYILCIDVNLYNGQQVKNLGSEEKEYQEVLLYDSHSLRVGSIIQHFGHEYISSTLTVYHYHCSPYEHF